MIREIFQKTNPNISNRKLIIFNGTPPKKVYEHTADTKSTLTDLKIYNNSLLRFDIDEDNFLSENYMDNSDNILAQQKELDKYKRSGENGNICGVFEENSHDNQDKTSFKKNESKFKLNYVKYKKVFF